ncbi:MAG: ABC transporter ATP-binding protein [Proteobacteria bacterium]|nr:ABC transporter ATP-binding protein [Pseudomonadota bacterium]
MTKPSIKKLFVKKRESPGSVISKNVHFLWKKHPFKIFVLIAFIITIQSLQLAPTILLGLIIDTITQLQVDTSLRYIMIFIATILAISCLSPFQLRYRDQLFQSTSYLLGLKWCESLLQKDFSFFYNFKATSLMRAYQRALSQTYRMYVFLFETVLGHICKNILIISYLIYLGGTWVLLPLSVGATILVAITLHVLKTLQPLFDRVNQAHDQLSQNHIQLFRSFKSIQSIGAYSTASQNLQNSYNNLCSSKLKEATWQSIIKALELLFPGIVSAAVILIALQLNTTETSRWQGGDFAVVFLLLGEMSASWTHILAWIPFRRYYLESQRHLQDALAFRPKNSTQNTQQLTSITTLNHFNINILPFNFHLSKTYSLYNKHPISIPFPAHVAIMGKSGGGKTTLAKIICNILPTQNTILIDKKDISSIPSNTLWRYLYYAADQPSFLELENCFHQAVMFGKTGLKDLPLTHDITHLKLQHLKEILIHGPWNQHKLSKGERKRIGLLRATRLNYPITVIDEPTESLDKELSKHTWNYLFKSFHNRTLICVTHDADILHRFDIILEVKDQHVRIIGNNKLC